MLPNELINPDSFEADFNPKHKSSFKNKSSHQRSNKPRKSKLLLSMPTKSEISFEKMLSLAQIHREANRPLIKIKDFDGQTKFCQCCSLPSRDDIYLRECSFCENTDKFAEFGRGTSLYFSFFKFSIFIMILCLLSMALPSFLLTSSYTKEITHICKKAYDIFGKNVTQVFEDCNYFIDIEGLDDESVLDEDDWELKFNSRNVLIYKKMYTKYGGSEEKINDITLNYNIFYLIGLASSFVVTILYIILLENINKQHDMNVTSPGDFTAIITNLYSAFDIFWRNINKINAKIKEKMTNQNSSEESKSQEKTNYSQIEMKEAKEIGLEDIPKKEEVNVFDAFNQFIKNKICITDDKEEKFNIYHINICYKIDEFMEKEEKIQEIKKEIYKINNEKFQIIKNRLMGLKDEKRRFFYNPLDVLDLNICQGECCEKYHVLSEIIDVKSQM